MVNMNQEKFKKNIESIFSSLSLKMDEEAKADPLFKYLESKSEWFDTPEHIAGMVFHKIGMIIDLIVDEKHKTNDWLVHDIYNNWDFYDCNITELCSSFYTSMCSADKGRFIVNSAIKWKLSGELPVFKRTDFWCPKKGSPEQWMALVEGLGNLRFGKPGKYFSAYKNLLEAHNIKKESVDPMDKTYAQQFKEALKCKNKKEAESWLEKEIKRYGLEFKRDEKDAREIILYNLGYMAGYYDHDTAMKIHELFGVDHPIFKSHDYHKTLTPQEAFDAGRRLGAGGKNE